MRQFDVYETPGPNSAQIAPYVLVIQSHFLEGLPTVIVAPLLRRHERPEYDQLSVPLEFAGEALVLSLAELVVVHKRTLQRRRGDLREHEDTIRRALDRVFTGF